MLRNLNQSSGGQRILGVPQVGILAAQIAAETATGDHGPGILYNESQEAGYAGKYLRAVVTSWPAAGALFVQENGAFEALGLPDGSHVFGYDLYVDGVYDSASAFTVAVGVVDATAPGATLTGPATLTPGSAAGESNASAPGATLTGTASIEPGAASGGASASAPGATLTGTASLDPGTATGVSAGTAPGATLTGSATLEPGSATGNQAAAAPGVTLTGSATLTPGAAVATNPDATAPGVVLTGSATLVPGVASDGAGLLPGPDRYRVRAARRNRSIRAAARNYTVTK